MPLLVQPAVLVVSAHVQSNRCRATVGADPAPTFLRSVRLARSKRSGGWLTDADSQRTQRRRYICRHCCHCCRNNFRQHDTRDSILPQSQTGRAAMAYCFLTAFKLFSSNGPFRTATWLWPCRPPTRSSGGMKLRCG